MCRFDALDTAANSTNIMFKYMICVGSINVRVERLQDISEFKYMICVGSIYRIEDEGVGYTRLNT